MKKNKIVLTATFTLLAGYLVFKYLDAAPKYQTRKIAENEQFEGKDANGAIAYNFSLRRNQITETIAYADVFAAEQEVMQKAALYKTNAGLASEWIELGPDNIGGRTRAILIDRNNPNRIYAGAVGGGLWISNDAAATWEKVSSKILNNLPITCITQAANNDIYFGTGEGLYNLVSDGTGASVGIPGKGIWKSTDNGQSFTQLQATIPVEATVGGTINWEWAAVNQIATDPLNVNRVYAATNRGLRISDNAGTTWRKMDTRVFQATDVDVATDGTVIAAVSGVGYISPNGEPNTFTIMNSGLPAFGIVGRIEFAFAPSSPNYVYASAVTNGASQFLQGIYQSIDKGKNWTVIAKGHVGVIDPKTIYAFEPFGINGQGAYNNSLAVFPHDSLHIVLGGVQLWSWKQNKVNIPGVGQWKKMALEFPNLPVNTSYVHSDKHTIQFHPTNDNLFYLGTDGGIFKTIDAGKTYRAMNRGYNVTQFYSVAFNNLQNAGVVAGAQDNGTLFISGKNYAPQNAIEVGGGDGFKCEISFINPKAFFTTVYYGAVKRSPNEGGTPADFYSKVITDLSAPKVGEAGFAAFSTPISLYESLNASNTKDSVSFTASGMTEKILVRNGLDTSYIRKLNPTQVSATVIPGTITIIAGNQIIKDNGTGKLIGDISTSIGAINTIDYATDTVKVTFAQAPALNTEIKIIYSVQYNPGSTITIVSKTSKYPFKYITPTKIDSNETIIVQDKIQSKLAVGFGAAQGIWLTKKPLDFTITPAWFNISKSIADETRILSWAPDGNSLYVGTANGLLYRISNLAAVTDSLSGDVASSTCIVNTKLIGDFNGRVITSIAIHPKNEDSLIVTLGNYANTNYIYLTGNASDTLNPVVFVPVQGVGAGKLPSMPVYSALFNMKDTKQIFVGTDFGVYVTDNIQNTSPVWKSVNNNAMATVPTLDIRQQKWLPTDGAYNSGTIYIATHGRGLWKNETYTTVGIKETKLASNNKIIQQSGIHIYPNPLREENATVAFNLTQAGKGLITIYDLQGRLVKSMPLNQLQEGTNQVSINSNELSSGTYLLNLEAENIHSAARFVVIK